MRILVTIIFCFVLSDLYSQKLDCGKVKGMTIDEAYAEITNYQRYTMDDARCFGNILAKNDKKRGVKRILKTFGLFETGCIKCIYHKYGFDTYCIGAGDITDENGEVFVDSYNRVMESSLSEGQRLDINEVIRKSTGVFNLIFTTKNNVRIEYANDTTLNIRMYSDSLDNLFKSDSNSILVEFSNKIQDGEIKRIEYSQLKNKGIDMHVKFIIDNKLYVKYDFSKIPNNYGICWCDVLDKTYGLIIPLKIE